MGTFSARTAAVYGLLVADVLDMHHAPSQLQPPVIAGSLLDQGWEVAGYLAAADILRGIQDPIRDSDMVYYGLVATPRNNPAGPVLVITRGTAGGQEWADDGDCFPYAYPDKPTAGSVSSGFYSIYRTLNFTACGTQRDVNVPACQSIAAHFPQRALHVIGHSLGAALATYLAFDLKPLHAAELKACLFACPNPGSSNFALAFENAAILYDNYAYKRDVVPLLPGSMSPLRTVLPLLPCSGTGALNTASIKADLLANHHVIDYAALLEPTLMNASQWAQRLIDDGCDRDCIEYLWINGKAVTASPADAQTPPALPALS
ncbi:MAG: lipase family protein [Janthinobacterium lividum]